MFICTKCRVFNNKLIAYYRSTRELKVSYLVNKTLGSLFGAIAEGIPFVGGVNALTVEAADWLTGRRSGVGEVRFLVEIVVCFMTTPAQ